MLNLAREWRMRGAGWRAAVGVIILQCILWIIDKAATLLFEHAMKPDWIEGALHVLSTLSSDRFMLGVLATSAIVLIAPYMASWYKLLCDRVARVKQESKPAESGGVQAAPYRIQKPKPDAPGSLPSVRGPAPAPSWAGINEFQLWEAACLWSEIEPTYPLPPDAEGSLRQLKTAICSRRLEVKPTSIYLQAKLLFNEIPRVDEIRDNAIVTRSQLLKYADSVKERPFFLS